MKALVISYHLNDENMGAIRIRRILKYLPRFGIELTVLTAKSSHCRAKEIPGVKIEPVDSLDLKAVYERLRGRSPGTPGADSPETETPRSKSIAFTSFLNRWFMVPDKQIPWKHPAVKRGRELIDAEEFDVIFASLDPRTNLLVAGSLARYGGLPCVMEYRDLWNDSPYGFLQHPSMVHKWLHHSLERKVLASATRLSGVCRGIQTYLKDKSGASSADAIGLNYNFFDPDEYLPRDDVERDPETFTIVYAGAMYASRNPYAFFKGFRMFVDRNRLTPEDVRFRWVGSVCALPELEESLGELKLIDYIDFQGFVSHAKALQILQEADVSLILQAPNDEIHIPGKLFEALGARVPVLAVANPCEVTDIIERVHGGIHVPHSPDPVAGALQRLWDSTRNGERWSFSEPEVRQFSAEEAVGRLAQLLKEAV